MQIPNHHSRVVLTQAVACNSLRQSRKLVMKRQLESSFAFGGALALLAAGCVCPPCAASAAGTAPVAAGSKPAAGSDGASLGADGMIWNGEGVGSAAKGWADCDKKPDCKAVLEPTPGAGKDGSVGLKFQGEGAGFVGMGWNWFGWYPENGGTDVSGQQKLSFWLRVEPASPELAPEPSAVTISIGASDKKNSASVAVGEYEKAAIDGTWHKIVVPLADLKKGEGKALDLKSVWEFRIGTWSASPRKFVIYVDDLGFEK
jgi:hypothetical protein